ncbi:MAG: toxin-antitoxin system HicB family antitoxin [Planctomycetota bacterium]|jgi:predicted HicB family RNase H-like nuclease|nr:toxin-antitoxin system HicB family antitoxin [Planctomycetota bacterium]
MKTDLEERIMATKNKLLEAAEELAQAEGSWADLSNALFGPDDGLIARAFPDEAERADFLKSDQYQAIRQLVRDAMKRTGLVEGATPQKSGRFVVRIPRSLHASLEAEATREGVSLNQLVTYKLAAQMPSEEVLAGIGQD